ncbi:MAG: hypothetical protein R3D70_14225 [Rhizobiaceae bacterium]
MSRWLQAAKFASTPNDKTDLTDKTPDHDERAPSKAVDTEVLSVLSVLSGGGKTDFHPAPTQARLDPERAVAEQATTSPDNSSDHPGVRSDAELYADALKRHSRGSYGSIGVVLGWGRTRAANAETVLREAGRIRYDQTGRGVFVEDPIPSRGDGEES